MGINGKLRTKAQVIGEKAVRFIQNEVLPENWVSREFTPDYGIDLDVELFDYEDGKCVTLGEHLFLQVKGTENPEYGECCDYDGKKERVIKYQLEVSELKLIERMGSAMPVLLVLVDLNEGKAFQICLNDYIRKVLVRSKPEYRKQRTVVINIPVQNEISKDNVKTLMWYGKRNKIYAMFHEMLTDIEDMKYMGIEECIAYGKEFVKHYLQYDVLYSDRLWPGLEHIKKKLDEMENNNGVISEMVVFVQQAFDNDIDWKEDIVFPRGNYLDEGINVYKYVQKRSIDYLGEIITNYSGMFETYCREWFMPGLLLGH